MLTRIVPPGGSLGLLLLFTWLVGCGVSMPSWSPSSPDGADVPADTDAAATPAGAEEAPSAGEAEDPAPAGDPGDATAGEPVAPTEDVAPSTADAPLPAPLELGPARAVDPWAGAPAEAEALDGWLAQERIPRLEARASRAEARKQAIDAYLDPEGTTGLARALPSLDGERLHELALLTARLRVLDARGEDRASERAHALEHEGKVADQAREALREAHQVEAAADDAERGLLLAMKAWLREMPSMRAEALEQVMAPWRERVRAARGVDPGSVGADAVLAEALAAEEALGRLQDTLRRLRDHRLAGRPVDVPDLAALEEASPGSGPLAADPVDDELLGLAWRRHALDAEQRATLDAATAPVIARRAEAIRSVADRVTEEARLPVPVAMDAVMQAETLRETLPPVLQPVGQALVDVAEARLFHAESAVVLSQADAEATRREAEATREGAQGAVAERTALLIEARLPTEARVEVLARQVEDDEARLSRQREAAGEILVDAREGQATIRQEGLPPEDLDGRYADLRTLLDTLRSRARDADAAVAEATTARREAGEEIARERMRIREERSALVDVSEVEVREAREAALERWEEVLEDEAELLDSRVQLATDARNAALRQLAEAADLRRWLSHYVSRQQRGLDQDGLFREMFDELSIVGPAYVATLRSRVTSVAEDPWWFLGVGVLRDVLLASLWLIGAIVVWLLARRYADTLVRLAMARVVARTPRLRASDLEPLRDPLRRLFVTGVDVIAAWMLFGLVPDGLPELAVLLLFIFEIQLLRLELALYDLLIGEKRALRPALARLDASTWRLGRRTVLAFGLWLSAFRILDAFVEDVIAGFATGLLLDGLRWIVLVVLAVVFLYLWAPAIRERIQRHPGGSAVTRFLGAKPPTVLLAGPLALGGLAFLLTVFLRDLAFFIARQAVVAQWFATLDRLRLGRSGADPENEPEPLPEEIAHRLRDDVGRRAFIDRPKARKSLLDGVASWNAERRQGLMAVLGDTGDGRGAALEHWSATWEEQGLETRWVKIDQRLATRRAALVWLARTLELSEVPDDVDDAVTAIEASQSEAVVIVSGLHLAFLRTVGGFDALRLLLEVWHADRNRCWILCFYRPSWRYLEKLGTTMNIHLVQEVIDLPGLDGSQLREMTTRLAEQAGYELDFQALTSTSAFAGDPEVERERAVESYYRLLSSASSGNPAVALDLWLSCLAPLPSEGDGPPRLAVRVSQEIRTVPLGALGDTQMFVLAAVRVQGELDEAELAEVLNMGRSEVRATVRQLISAGLLDRSERGVHLARATLPAVTLTLRRRHFLHWGPT